MTTKHQAGGDPRFVDGGTAGTASAGGASASELHRGYAECGHHQGYETPADGELGSFYSEPSTGFLNRPQGWER